MKPAQWLFDGPGVHPIAGFFIFAGIWCVVSATVLLLNYYGHFK